MSWGGTGWLGLLDAILAELSTRAVRRWLGMRLALRWACSTEFFYCMAGLTSYPLRYSCFLSLSLLFKMARRYPDEDMFMALASGIGVGI